MLFRNHSSRKYYSEKYQVSRGINNSFLLHSAFFKCLSKKLEVVPFVNDIMAIGS